MDLMKYAIGTCLIILLFDIFVVGKINTKRLSDSDTNIRTISRKGLKSTVTQFGNRLRRSSSGGVTGDAQDSSKQPIVNITKLNDYNHNEAIVHWSGNNSDVMFILTRQHSYSTVNDSKVWRSDDYGTTFHDVTKQITKTGILSFYHISPNNKNILLFVDKKNKMIYSTTDEGKTYIGHKVNFEPNKLIFHPTISNLVLAYSPDRTLYYSDDLFASYGPVHTNVNPRFFWAVDGYDKDNHVIHMEILDSKTGHYMYKAVTSPYPKDVTVDSSIGSIDVDSLIVEKEYIFIQKTTPFNSHLYVSHRRGPFKRAYFPQSRHPQDFTVVAADEHQVFIAANHHEGMVSLYLSDTTGQFYTTSLNNVVFLQPAQGGFEADLYEVKGMAGTYIANQHTASNPKSLITFDQGGRWQIIPAPEKDLNGKPYNCTTQSPSVNCGLHLHLQFSSTIYRIPYIVSEANAPGKILAHGVVGTELTPKKSSLFMSSNGGLTWRPVFDDGNQYRVKILDQGAAMVSMPIKSGLTQSIKYSSTEGKTWESYSFKADSGIQVEGVINEPGINTLVVSVFGHDTKDSGWTIAKINFTSILSVACEKEDFESWIPSDEIGGTGCLLGQRMVYDRRKTDSQCYIKRDYEMPINTSQCVCQEEDYECDYGYSRDEKDPSKCIVTSWYNSNNPVGDCPEDTYYPKSKGHRKVAADKCTGGLSKYDPVNTKCPVMKAEGLIISVKDGITVVATAENITFQLIQEKGSKKYTNYSWIFSDDNITTSAVGYDKGQYQHHIFKKPGMYVVTVRAEHPGIKGATTTTITILVEDHLQGMEVLIPHGAQINKEVTFQAVSLGNTLGTHVHFIWTFGDEGFRDKPLLTWNQSAQHVYKKPGNYTAVVETFNNVGSIFRTVPVIVYGTLSTVQLSFNLVADNINTRTQLWRDLFGAVLKKALLDALALEPSRLQVVVLPKLPTLADVSILPSQQSMTSDPVINVITTEILKIANSKTLSMTLSEEEFSKNQIINVTGGTLVTDSQPASVEKDTSYVAVYICIPLLMIAVFITVLIVLYYKKKYRQLNRYSLLEARSGEPDALLDDTDDDDPLLDPTTDQTAERLAFSDDDIDDPLSAHLRLGSTTGRQSHVNC